MPRQLAADQASKWQARIAEQQRSGEPKTQFCRRHGLCVKTFYRWRARLCAQPAPDLGVIWLEHEQEPPHTTDAFGKVNFVKVDRQRSQRFNLQFPKDVSALPTWPTQKAIDVALDSKVNTVKTPQVIRKTIELRPLQWLLLRTGAFQVPTEHRAGNPYPIFVLQHQRDGRWLDNAAEHFIPVPEGVNSGTPITNSPTSVCEFAKRFDACPGIQEFLRGRYWLVLGI